MRRRTVGGLSLLDEESRLDQEDSAYRGTDLNEVAGRLRRYWRVISALTVAGVAAGAAYALLATPTYESSASVLVRSIAVDTDAVGASRDDINLDTQAQIVTSTDLAAEVVDDLGSALAPDELREHVSVSVPPNSQVLTITFSASTAESAAAGAQAYADAYLQQRRDEGRAFVEQEVQALDGQLASLRADLAAVGSPTTDVDAAPLASAERSILVDQISEVTARLTPLLGAEISGGRVISPATIPSSAAKPVLAIDLAAGLLLGLLAGIAVAVTADAVDPRVHVRQDVVRRTGLPVLVELSKPLNDVVRASRAMAPVRTAPALRGRSSTVTTVLSLDGDDGVAAALATSVSSAGQACVLVVLDPTSASPSTLGGEPTVGLSDVLSGEAELEAALIPAGVRNELMILSAGTRGELVEDLVQSPAFRRLLDDLRLRALKVVVEARSTDESVASLSSALASEATLLVVTKGVTRHMRVRGVTDLLTARGGHVEGTVLVPRRALTARARSTDVADTALVGRTTR